MIDLHGRRFRIASTSDGSVVSAGTILTLERNGPFICGHYSGGAIVDGRLIGSHSGAKFHFRYVQGDEAGTIDSGVSDAEVEAGLQGRVKIIEHYRWVTREGTGTNIFVEILSGEA